MSYSEKKPHFNHLTNPDDYRSYNIDYQIRHLGYELQSKKEDVNIAFDLKTSLSMRCINYYFVEPILMFTL